MRETAEMFWNRYNAGLAAGLTEEEAVRFSTYGDLWELRKLVDGGCSVELIRRIVL